MQTLQLCLLSHRRGPFAKQTGLGSSQSPYSDSIPCFAMLILILVRWSSLGGKSSTAALTREAGKGCDILTSFAQHLVDIRP